MRDTPQVLRRILSLERFAIFASVDPDELATIAENLVETTLRAGTVVTEPGSWVGEIQLVLEGRIDERPHGHSWGPYHVHGALEILASRRAKYRAVATTEVRMLRMSAGDVGEVLEDNFGVLRATLRELAARASMESLKPHAPLPPLPSQLGLVERLIALRHQWLFAGSHLQALTALAHASEEVTLPAGTVIAKAGEGASDAYILLDGEVLSHGLASSSVLRPGASIGHLALLAGAGHLATVETTGLTRMLRSSASSILDVIEDHTDVGMAMLAAMAGALLDAHD